MSGPLSAVNSPSHSPQVMGASARVEAAARIFRPQVQVAATRLVLRRPVLIKSDSQLHHEKFDLA